LPFFNYKMRKQWIYSRYLKTACAKSTDPSLGSANVQWVSKSGLLDKNWICPIGSTDFLMVTRSAYLTSPDMMISHA
jgi:hypothetical protein